MWQEYKKALAPVALVALTVLLELVFTGEWNRPETATAFTGFIAAGITFLVPNIPNDGLWRYLKAIVPAFVTLSTAVAIWIETGTLDDGAVQVFLTGAGSALVALILSNGGNTNEVGSKVTLAPIGVRAARGETTRR